MFNNLLTSKFYTKVWKAISCIPQGKVCTYKELARRAGYPKAIRAVATAVGKNPHLISVPCHRVILSSGYVGEYSGKGGKKAKILLLQSEGLCIEHDRVITKNAIIES